MFRFPALLPIVVCALLPATGCQARKVGALHFGPLELQLVEARSPRTDGAGSAPASEGLAGIVCSVLEGGEVTARGVTAPDGTVRFDHAAREGVEVDVFDPSGRFVREKFRLGRPGRHVLELRRGFMVRMRLESESGALREPAEITVWLPGGRVETFRFEGSEPASIGPFPEGPAKFVIAAPGHVSAILDVSIERRNRAGDPVVDLGTVRLRAGGARLTGRVRAPERRMPDKVLVRYSGAGRYAPVFPDGSFQIEGLPEAGAEPLAGRPEASVVFLRGSQEIHVRRVSLAGNPLDLGTVALR